MIDKDQIEKLMTQCQADVTQAWENAVRDNLECDLWIEREWRGKKGPTLTLRFVPTDKVPVLVEREHRP